MLPERLQRVIKTFARLPGVGEKTAQRLALYLANDGDLCERLAQRWPRQAAAPANVVVVERDESGAASRICLDAHRDGALLCIVARVRPSRHRKKWRHGRYFKLCFFRPSMESVRELPLDRLQALSKDTTEII